MILKTLTLKNYRTFRQVTITFPEGVVGIIGLNGVGKSTLFEAIAWVLYGTVAARTSADQIKRFQAEPADPCRVELEFTFQGESYRVVREMKGRSLTVSASITREMTLVATGAGAVTVYIQNLLGLDFKSFFTSIFAKQNELNTLSIMNPHERRPLILKMLGIDSLDDIIREVNADRRNTEKVIDTLSQQLIDSSGKEKKTVLLQRIQSLKTQRKELKQSLQQTQVEQEEIQERSKEAQKAVEELRSRFEQMNNQFDQLIKQKGMFDKREALILDLDTIECKIKKRKETIQQYESQLKGYGDTDDEINSVEKRMKTIEKTRQNHSAQIQQNMAFVDQQGQIMKELKRKHRTIQKMGSAAACPTCERVLGDQYEFLLSKYQEEYKQKKREQDQLQKVIQQHREEEDKLRNEIQALQKKQAYLLKQKQKEHDIRTRVEAMNQELSAEEHEKQQKQAMVEHIGDISFQIEEYDQVKKQRDQIYAHMEKSQKQYDKIQQMLLQKHHAVEKTKSEDAILIHQINATKKEREQLIKWESDIGSQREQAERLTLLYEVMKEFRLHLISRIRPALSSYATDFYQDLTDGKYQDIALDDQYNISIADRGTFYPIDRFSGGEIDLANLCLRLAISEIITERAGGLFQFIILDEIFGSQDSIRQQNIMDALYRLRSKFHQIFLITHVEELKNTMQSIIKVEEGDDASVVIQK